MRGARSESCRQAMQEMREMQVKCNEAHESKAKGSRRWRCRSVELRVKDPVLMA
jgi:hypothetical protein